MRATFGRIAVVLLLSIGMCGCKTGSNMFGWNHKKPSDSTAMSDAPPYKPKDPALPSAGQTPTALQTNVPGSAVAAATPGAAPAAAAGSYSSMPAGYQQSTYPTTPFNSPKLGATGASGVAATTPATPATAHAAAPSGGYASAVGTGNALPPAAGYVPNSATASAPSQPQAGFYNPAYGAGSTGAPTPYATAAASNPAYNYNAPSASSAAAATTPAATEYRMADARGAMLSAPATVSATPGAAPSMNSSVGDRYSSAPASNVVGDRYSSAPTTNTISATTVPSPASTTTTITAPTSPAGDRYSQPNDYYRPPASSTEPAATSYGAPSASAAPASMPSAAATESPLRRDPSYRPGGTSDYAPGGNTLRPSSTNDTTSGNAQPAPQASHGVTPASYQTSSATPPAVMPAVSATLVPPTDDRYGAYRGAGSNAEPAYGASAPGMAQTAAYSEHSW